MLLTGPLSTLRVASKRHVLHALAMLLTRFALLKRLLPMSRRERARLAVALQLAQIDRTCAGMAAIADVLRDLSARHDAPVHAIQQTARASRGALTEAGDANSIRNVFLGQATDAAVRSKRTAESLDAAVEALERLAAGLRDGWRH